MSASKMDFFRFYKNLDGNAKMAIYEGMPVFNPEGRRLSEPNTAFLAFQSELKFTIVAGYKQWMKHGRCVKKGQHGVFIFIPALNKKKGPEGQNSTEEELEKFLVARVFDISQTFEMKEQPEKVEEVVAEEAFEPVPEYEDLDDDPEYEEEKYGDRNPYDLFDDLYTDADGRCYSDADPGL